MLRSLHVKDFAIVREVEIEFGPGLTVVSGETGAGKSLLVDALMLLAGARADAATVRHGAERAELGAEFALAAGSKVHAWLAEQALDENGSCAVRRIVRADGGSRAWINGRPASVGQLVELGRQLLEIHGQHEHQALLERSRQLDLLDAFGNHGTLREEVATQAAEWQRVNRQIGELVQKGDVSERVAWLRFQLDELRAETLDADSIARLTQDHRRLSNAAALIQGCESVLARLSGEEGMAIVPNLRRAQNEIERLRAAEPALAEVGQLLDSSAIQLEEAISSLNRIRDQLDIDPGRLQEMEARLSRLQNLARKHRVGIEALAQTQGHLLAELEELQTADQALAQLTARRHAIAVRWKTSAGRLSQARVASAQTLSDAVTALMAGLGMRGGRFEVQLEPLASAEPSPQGAERMEFLVSVNPGQPLRPLRKVASGGELSRISLAIEVAAMDLAGVETLVFDEVDSGIGGAVAEAVGKKLRALGTRRQALCVTHLPQVAAQGHAHLRVSKASEANATHSQVVRLDPETRIEELARMLGGIEIGRETRAHARQMLESATADK